ncbi:MAG: class I mannose-6-phosphate isomerase [Chloroflexi bacterium]|nr:class I mannose-6-phosphate isomerase [Chloroflexota bacterium]
MINAPLLLESKVHTRVWGGRKLGTQFGKTLPTDDPYGESWEVCDDSVVASGPLAGRSLGDLLDENPRELVGPDFDPAQGFPLLVKLLDAQKWLSIQVHPNDEQAQALEDFPRGKTEAWYILDSDPGAELVIGLQPGASREELAEAIRANRLEQLTVRTPVDPGDVLHIPAGTVHAIGPGLVIYEIQQACDITYRLYDWGRMGLDGKPRQLHIDKGLSVANLTSLPQIQSTGGLADPLVTVIRSDYFITQRVTVDGALAMTLDESQFATLTCVAGAVDVRANDASMTLGLGQSGLIPAALNAYDLDGSGILLISMPV